MVRCVSAIVLGCLAVLGTRLGEVVILARGEQDSCGVVMLGKGDAILRDLHCTAASLCLSWERKCAVFYGFKVLNAWVYDTRAVWIWFGQL